MAKTPFDDYLKEITFQREIWQRKPILQILYHRWYAEIVANLSALTPTVEIGAGCGNFKAFYPQCIATDVFKSGPWIDRVVDAHALDFADGEVGNIVVIDVLHHLQRPLEFLRQAAKALKPGGRLVVCEPAVTPWSRLVYGFGHHEPIDTHWDLFGLDGTPPDPDPGHTFANMGIAELLFWKFRAKTLEKAPSFKFIRARKTAFLLYPMTGGFSYKCYAPKFGFATALKIEDFVLRPFANWLTGMRMIVVLERA
ncbi:MAG TPA: methyltransferase domain-containing protein [Planctomycetota bacterium]|nr:methyltransferase domain-containing protein [Planctomycetota bacterium]